MKAIELMQRLGELVTTYGDLDVVVDQDRNAAGWEDSPINEVRPVDGKLTRDGKNRIVIQGGY